MTLPISGTGSSSSLRQWAGAERPSAYLKALLEKAESPRPLAHATTAKPQRSILADLGGRSADGVVGGTFAWANDFYVDGSYTLTLKNQLREPVRNVYCLVVFYSRDGNPLDVSMVRYRELIPAGLGKRVSGSVDPSVKRLTTPPARENRYISSFEPSTRVEFRVLDFEIVQ
jgi:hypothetical protein